VQILYTGSKRINSAARHLFRKLIENKKYTTHGRNISAEFILYLESMVSSHHNVLDNANDTKKCFVF
jgi:hypothetical protein